MSHSQDSTDCKPPLLQLVNVTVWIIPNAMLVHNPCQHFSHLTTWCTFIGWTCWYSIFTIMIIEAHNSSPWKSYKGQPLHCHSCCQPTPASAPAHYLGGSLVYDVQRVPDCLRQVKYWCLQGTARAFLSQPFCADSPMVSAGKRKDVLIMDRPFYSHWPKLVVFLFFEINNLFINIWISSGEVQRLLLRCA